MGSWLLAIVTRGWQRFAVWHANLGAVLLLANVIMLSLFVFITATGRDVYVGRGTDFEENWGTATRLLDSGVYGNAFESPTRMRQPFYPYFLASLRAVQGDSYSILRLSQIVVILAGILVAYYLARSLWGARAALAGALLLALHPLVLFNAVQVTNEPHFILLLLLCLLCLVAVTRRPSVLLTLLAGGLLGMAALTRPVAFPLPFIIGALWVLPLHLLPLPWPRRVLHAGLLVGATLLVMLPWAVRNCQDMGVFTFLSSERGAGLWSAAQPGWRWGYSDPLVDPANIAEYNSIRGGDSLATGRYVLSQAAEGAFTQAAFRHIFADPLVWATKNAAKLVADLLLLPGLGGWFGALWLAVQAGHLAMLALAGWGVSRIRLLGDEHLLVFLVALYFILVLFPLSITPLDLEPTVVILALFAGYALDYLLSRVRQASAGA